MKFRILAVVIALGLTAAFVSTSFFSPPAIAGGKEDN